jgi:hypothetical protein
MKSLNEIVMQECLPQRDCMLTLQDINGEVGFLYFQEAELIEANYAALWGKEAVAQVLEWQLAEYTVGSLPLGIKRSVWDSIESLLRLSAATEAALAPPQFHAEKIVEHTPSPYDAFKQLPGVTRIFLIENKKQTVEFEAQHEPAEPTEWMTEFYLRARSVGETLGLGKLQRFSIITDRYQVVGLSQEKNFLCVLRKHDVGNDDFEAACEASISKP